MAVERIETGQDEGEEIVKVKSVNRPSTAKARTLRRKFTDAELKLWNHLRGRRIGGERFRRQQPLGRYVVDFVCLEKKLIAEVDGGQHAAPEYDKERTIWLESEGFRVIRFWNNEVLKDQEGVLDAIYKELKNSPSPQPSPLKGEGERLAKAGMGTSAIGERCPDAHSFASVPSRERVKKQARWDWSGGYRKDGMKRKRSESLGNGLGIFDGYDPVIESMLLEWEVERRTTCAGNRRSSGGDDISRTANVGCSRDGNMTGDCASGGGDMEIVVSKSGAADTSKDTLHTSCVQEAGVAWDEQSRVKEFRDVV